MRELSVRISRGGGTTALLLLCLAMVMRFLVPAGWMPVQTANGGWAITLCTGSGPMRMTMAGPMRMTMAGPMHAGMAGMHHGSDRQDHGPGDHPCAFSSLAMALDEPPPLVIDLPALVVETWANGSVSVVSIGRGLAAPPPPSTGPPHA